jgi:hypothetical protein
MSGMKALLAEAIEAIDATLGEGYAKRNPDLISGLIRSEVLSFGAFQISDAIACLSDIEVETTH